MDDIRTILGQRIDLVRSRIDAACRRSGRDASAVTIVGVTKTVSADIARIAFELGLQDLGESKPQELWKKAEAIREARWHLIGHLQRNKIDRTIPVAALVHSVDSIRLLTALDSVGRKRDSPVPILLEMNCSREDNKGGFLSEELPELGEKLSASPGVTVQGLMTMAAHFDNPEQCRPAFAELRELRDRLRTATGSPLPHLSMGMSNDFEIAVEEGASLVRIGTTLFEGLH
jgi:pyridoxal phosphate enzyme (YggS family)